MVRFMFGQFVIFLVSVDYPIAKLNSIGFNALNTIFWVVWKYILVMKKIQRKKIYILHHKKKVKFNSGQKSSLTSENDWKKLLYFRKNYEKWPTVLSKEFKKS